MTSKRDVMSKSYNVEMKRRRVKCRRDFGFGGIVAVMQQDA
jgi:hypothetical protein